MYRSPSPYHGSPYTSPETHYSNPYVPTQSPGGGPAITPGSITYTTSTGPDGQIIYHPFKAVPASYQTPTGVVSGIQWVPAEATQVLPAGAQPASSDFAEAWNRGHLSKEDQKTLKEWQRAEDKRRRKEEKESARMLREKERMTQARYDDPDLRLARERDAATRERRKSFSQTGGVGFPRSASPNGYLPYAGSDRTGYAASTGAPMYPPPSPRMGYARERKYSTGGGLADQFADLGIDGEGDRIPPGGLARPRKYSTHETVATERARRLSGNFGAERPTSMYAGSGTGPVPATGAYAPPRAYSATGGTGAYTSTSPYMNPSPRLRSAEPGFVPPQAPRPSSPYANPNYSPNQDPYAPRAASPYARASSPYARAASPYHRAASPFNGQTNVYPPGHIMEGRPIMPAGGSRSRATTPLPGAIGQGVVFPTGAGAFPQPSVTSPHLAHAAPPGTLAAPECFSRPINAAHPYTPFETMKIQDMDAFLEVIPKMPLVLQPHDVYAEDWARLVDDVALAWSGRLPLPSVPTNGKPPKRATLAAKLIELWNHSFFERRGIELVLYKGRERRSGAYYGVVDLPLPVYDDSTDSVSSSSSSSDDELDDDPRYSGAPYGFYGRNQGVPTDAMEARQRRIAAKAEKKRRRKEKKARRKAKAREKKYALYLTCLPQGGPGGTGAPTYGGPVGMGGMLGGLAGSNYSSAPAGPGYRSISPVPGAGAGYGGMPPSTGGW